MITKAKPLKLYMSMSSAHEEARLAEEFLIHLSFSEKIEKSSPDNSNRTQGDSIFEGIGTGTMFVRSSGKFDFAKPWRQLDLNAASQADLILMLVGKHYLADKQLLAEREACLALAATGKPTFLVILNPCLWQETSLGTLPNLMEGDKTLVEMDEPARDRFYMKLVKDMTSGKLIRPQTSVAANGFSHVTLNRLVLNQFKCFQSLNLDFTQESVLDGNWTCIAGINGAGKTTILESIALCLLGDHAVEFGGNLLGRKCREGVDGGDVQAHLTVDGDDHQLLFPIDPRGFDRIRFDEFATAITKQVYRKLEHALFLSFGVTRDFGGAVETEKRESVYRHNSLFVALEPIFDLNFENKANEGLDRNAFLKLLQAMFDLIPEFPIMVRIEGERLKFEFKSRTPDPVELPSGLRAMAIMFGQLIRCWCLVAPDLASQGELAPIRGLVLVDEIDLHLHPKLQRTLIPRLRKALPNLQWIVTTHSPLVLSAFDHRELIWLDENNQPQPVESQILGFTPDQIYERLMDTPSESYFREQHRKFSSGETEEIPDAFDPEMVDTILSQGLYPDKDKDSLKEELDWWNEQVARIKEQDS